MKKVVLKGHPLTDDVMKEVKGGYMQTGTDPENWNFCPCCGKPYSDDELEALRYDGKTGLYGRFCMECGGFIVEE